MVVIQTYPVAVLFCIVTMLCWGSWANAQKLAGKDWRFEAFYIDYAFGVLLAALAISLTFGSFGASGRTFIEDLRQAEILNLGSAFLGGLIFNCANILLVASISLAGLAVAFPVGVGLALALGVVSNYLVLPVGDPVLLTAGVLLIVAAMLLSGVAHSKHFGTDSGGESAKRARSKGLKLAVIAGLLMGGFYRFVAVAMITNFEVPESGLLTPYAAVFVFALGVLMSSAAIVPVLMRHPIHGRPINLAYYFQGTLSQHLAGLAGGVIWSIGMQSSILASEKAGFAISYGLGQGATLVAALWGLLVWKEFKGSPRTVQFILGLMLLAYVVGLSILVVART
jgi:glucose uptake protein